ncbi:hypothetical protein SAMN04488498_12813 [Mesorhizobium albiziae]|uniref:Uncharacterized protein n=1 Tax=Neomesorhizobium albiziae TaxID=335020 RepID=A0A1I4ERB0_9HYPH|nr:hypothetical protein SAMN04488498_12813 [Mesorhizobium albiziae]
MQPINNLDPDKSIAELEAVAISGRGLSNRLTGKSAMTPLHQQPSSQGPT